MAGVKRSREGVKAQGKADLDSPYIPLFEAFRAELDEHHDRREKIIKASRDITASSKKMWGLHALPFEAVLLMSTVYSLCSGKTYLAATDCWVLTLLQECATWERRFHRQC